MADRFMSEVKALEIMRDLTSSAFANRYSEVKSRPFFELKDAFLWAVAIGVQEAKKTPLQGKKDGVFFTKNLNDDQRAFLQAVAIADSENLSLISDEDSVNSIAEEYANTGAYRLREILLGEHGDPLFNLVNVIRSESRKVEGQ